MTGLRQALEMAIAESRQYATAHENLSVYALAAQSAGAIPERPEHRRGTHAHA